MPQWETKINKGVTNFVFVLEKDVAPKACFELCVECNGSKI